MDAIAAKNIFLAAEAAAALAILQEVKARPEDPYAFDCGFAWVVVKPARGPFVKFCKDMIATLGERSSAARKYGDKNWDGGWCFWKPGSEVFNGQSIRIFEAGARAFAKVLNDNGINASVGSRLD
jgi:hypothetical protein